MSFSILGCYTVVQGSWSYFTSSICYTSRSVELWVYFCWTFYQTVGN